MADDPHTLAREAKALAVALKDNLKKREPWDKEIEFQRRNLQKQYLLLLLSHPRAKESKDVETLLWMQTSHALIAPYKTRISAIEKALRDVNMQKQQGKRQQHGPVEHRKLVHRYRQYLAGEEKFWMQLIARLHEQFALHEADHIVASLGITSTDDAQGSRSHFQFPAPPAGSVPSSDPNERAGYISILAKALVCLGDLARYRELASDAGPRRQEDATKRGGRSNRGKLPVAPFDVAPKTLDRSRTLYEAARSLAPDDGNPPHQLAILALHKRDSFEGVVQNYRALCARQPYVTAAGNLTSILRGALLEYQKAHSAQDGRDTRQPTVETFKRDVIALYASCRTGGDVNLARNLATKVASIYSKLISDRLLSVDLITKVLTLAQGTLWHISREKAAKGSTYLEDASSLVLANLLSLYRSLFDISAQELQEPMTPGGRDLAMRITAVFRRMLPALRVTGKWLRAKDHLDMILTSASTTTQPFWQSYTVFFARITEIFPPDQLPRLARQLDEDVELVGYLPLGGLLFSRTDPAVLASEDRRALEDVHPNEEQLMRIWDIWHDASLVAELAPEQMRSFRAYSTSRQPSKAQTPTNLTAAQSRAPLGSQTLSRYPPPQTAKSVDDDARTETTDPVGDAFRQALGEDDDSDDEEILFNPRASIMSVAPEAPEPPLSTQHTPTKQVPMHPSTPSAPPPSIQLLAPTNTITPPKPDATGSTSLLPTPTHVPTHRGSSSSSTPAIPHTPKTTAQDLLANVLGRGAPSRTARRVSQASQFAPTSGSTRPASDPTTPSLHPGNAPGPFGAGQSIWSASVGEHAVGAHHRRLSQSGMHGATSLRSTSQPHPWTGTSERHSYQQNVYATPPPALQNAAPPTAFPTSLQQPTLQVTPGIGIGLPPSGAHAHRRLSGSNTSSLLAQHSYLPQATSQPTAHMIPSYPQLSSQGHALPHAMNGMHLGAVQPPQNVSGTQGAGDMRAYGAIGGMATGGVPYAGGLQSTGLGIAGGIWGPAG
ncbi:unnamed protein product [Peniophora sp. CBMAI 1063]|nr:unnamed protein product [Peniophora sp. CBMAI 1063]